MTTITRVTANMNRMPNVAKTLMAAISAAAVTANLVAAAHGWANVDWAPIATLWAGVVAVFAYPNG